MIRYITHTEIDKYKWDECITQSINGNVYALSWYLDGMCGEQWDALIWKDYEAVFPLTKAKKVVEYLYQPFFMQQLGLFYRTRSGADQLSDFINAIPKKFRYIDIQLNEWNVLQKGNDQLTKRKNFLLDLDKPYARLAKQYNNHAVRNLKKSNKQILLLTEVGFNDAVDFYIKYKGLQTLNVGNKHYKLFRKVLDKAHQNKMLSCYGVLNEQNEWLACGIFFRFKNRISYTMGTVSQEGKEKRAMYYLFDRLIQQESEKPYFLDFEGSDMEGVARFFKGFGAGKANYFRLKINRLPWLIRWLK